MRCLTLTEPWATLVAIGAKKIETRSWSTTFRGPIAIHAAKSMPNGARDAVQYPGPIRSALGDAIGEGPLHAWEPARYFDQTRGRVLAVAQLVACVSTNGAMMLSTLRIPGGVYPLSDDELEFGNYEPGRYAWLLSNVQRLREPIPARGALGLWELDDALLAGLAVS